jgi:SNF2 family DNA or RNA helicase
MAMEYELFPNRCSDMRAHVVVTSYEAPVDDHSRSFFKRIKWAGMIVDEGQRLKNDENLLYVALKALRTPFQVLLTGKSIISPRHEDTNMNVKERLCKITRESYSTSSNFLTHL